MVSRQLWRALNHPPRQHPLFKYVLTHAKSETPKVTSGFFMWMFLCSTMTFFWAVIFDWIPYLVIGLLLLFNTVYSLRWASRISGEIGEEKEQRRFDLLSSLPFGSLGTSWAISTGCLHRRSSFIWMPYLMGLISLITVITMAFMAIITALVMDDVSPTEAVLAMNFNILQISMIAIPMIVLFYFDHIYTILTATLIGIAATVEVEYSAEARLRAILGFVAVQLFVYILCATVFLVALPTVLGGLGQMGIGVIVLASVFAVFMFITLREAIVRWLWHYITDALDAESNEVELVLNAI